MFAAALQTAALPRAVCCGGAGPKARQYFWPQRIPGPAITSGAAICPTSSHSPSLGCQALWLLPRATACLGSLFFLGSPTEQHHTPWLVYLPQQEMPTMPAGTLPGRLSAPPSFQQHRNTLAMTLPFPLLAPARELGWALARWSLAASGAQS